MRNMLALPLIALLTVSCATTDTASGKTDQRAIESVIFIKSSPPVSATLRRDQTLTVSKDLSTRFEIKDGYNKMLNEKAGKITSKQFKTLSEKLNEVDYTRLKTQKRAEPLAGSPTNTLVIKSDQGAHRFIEGAMTTFPDELKAIFTAQTEYVPTTPVVARAEVKKEVETAQVATTE